MTTKYKILFMVELLHDYYANQQCRDFDVVPSLETGRLIRNRQMMCKMVGNKLVVLVKVNADGADEDKPLVSLNKADKFIFYLQLNKPAFNIVTNLDTDKLRDRKRYYFTNLYQNDLSGKLDLTQRIVPVIGNADYVPGDFTGGPANKVFECIKSTDQTNNPPDATFWFDRDVQQYASGKDMISPRTRVETFTLTTPAKLFQVEVLGLNLANNLYDAPIAIADNTLTSVDDTKQVQVRFPELSPGRYKVKINTDEFDLFIDDAAVYTNAFGIVEIFSHFADGTPFAFLDNTGKVKDKLNAGTPEWLKYQIRFANRLAYWQYNTPKHGVVAIDGTAPYSFLPTPAAGDKDFFTSNLPIPLRETPWKFKVNVPSLSAAEDPFAPNPDATMSGMLTRTKTEKDYYCTINLSY